MQFNRTVPSLFASIIVLLCANPDLSWGQAVFEINDRLGITSDFGSDLDELLDREAVTRVAPADIGLDSTSPALTETEGEDIEITPKVSFSIDPRFTSNAFFSEDDEESDFAIGSTLTAGAITDFKNGLKLDIRGTIGTRRFLDNSVLDRDQVGGRAEGSYTAPKIGVFLLGYTPSASFETDFDEHAITRHPIRFQFGRKDPLGKSGIALSSVVSASRTFADPSEFNQTGIFATLVFSKMLGNTGLELSVAPEIGGQVYDDFFGDDREDIQLAGSASLSYELGGNFSATLTSRVDKNYSNLDRLEYLAFTQLLSLAVKF